MLYVSTRSSADTYTAYRALHEAYAPDGGFYVPFHLPTFADEELSAFRMQSCTDVIAQILNLFFGLHLGGWDVECAIGRVPFKLEAMHHKLLVAELWRNPDASFDYLLKNLFNLTTKGESNGRLPAGWSCVAIKIAILFGIYSAMEDVQERFDVAVPADDFTDISAVSFAKDMGLPVNLIICTCEENSAIWDLVNRGELNTGNAMADYLECFLYKSLGADNVLRYLDARNRNAQFTIDEIQKNNLCNYLFAVVVSENRANSVATSIYRTNQYNAAADMALAYGGLQDYRSATGVSKNTLILAKN